MTRLVAIVGPTAVGKTELALELASRFPVEVINADSRQVYRYMDIGTGKPTVEERSRVPHHVIDVVEPDDEFSLATYLTLARKAIESVRARGRLPFVVGGTGLYVWSLLEGWQVPHVPPDAEFRESMQRLAEEEGAGRLYEMLQQVDAAAAERIEPNNARRIIRALEVHRVTGRLPSEVLWHRTTHHPDALILGLRMERDTLVARADARIDRMIRNGFADEVRRLLEMGYAATFPSMSSIGYREMSAYVQGRMSLDETVMAIRRETRRLIRRQRAWFRPDDERINWVDYGWPEEGRLHALRLVSGEAG